MAKKKAAVKKRAKPEKSIFDTFKQMLQQVSVDYICRDLEDLKFFQAKDSDKEQFQEIVSETLDVDSCYVHLNPEKRYTQFVGFIKNLTKIQVYDALQESLGFNPFQQKGLLPNNLCNKKQYSLEDIANVVSVISDKIGKDSCPADSCFNPPRLIAYSQAQQMIGKKSSPEEISLHPYIIAMTVVGKQVLPKEKRMRFRYITMGALQADNMVEKFLEKDIWKMWASRKMDDNKRIIALDKNMGGLFIAPCARIFCTAAETIGRAYLEKNKRRLTDRTREYYVTEGYQAYLHYAGVVEAYKELLGQKKHSGSGAGEE